MSDHQKSIMSEIGRLFRAFPASKNVDAMTLEDYCEESAAFELDVIRAAVNQFRLGEVKRSDNTFAPSLPVFISALRGRAEAKRLRSFAGLSIVHAPIKGNTAFLRGYNQTIAIKDIDKSTCSVADSDLEEKQLMVRQTIKNAHTAKPTRNKDYVPPVEKPKKPAMPEKVESVAPSGKLLETKLLKGN